MENRILVVTLNETNWRDTTIAGLVQMIHAIVPGLDDIPERGQITLNYERQGGGAKCDKPRKVRVKGRHSLTISGSGEAVMPK